MASRGHKSSPGRMGLARADRLKKTRLCCLPDALSPVTVHCTRWGVGPQFPSEHIPYPSTVVHHSVPKNNQRLDINTWSKRFLHLGTEWYARFCFRVNARPKAFIIIQKGMFDRVRIKVYRGYLLGAYPVEVFGKVRYGLNTLPDTPVCFGANSIPVFDTSVS